MMKWNRIEEWIGLWMIVALLNRLTTPRRLKAMVSNVDSAVCEQRNSLVNR